MICHVWWNMVIFIKYDHIWQYATNIETTTHQINPWLSKSFIIYVTRPYVFHLIMFNIFLILQRYTVFKQKQRISRLNSGEVLNDAKRDKHHHFNGVRFFQKVIASFQVMLIDFPCQGPLWFLYVFVPFLPFLYRLWSQTQCAQYIDESPILTHGVAIVITEWSGEKHHKTSTKSGCWIILGSRHVKTMLSCI